MSFSSVLPLLTVKSSRVVRNLHRILCTLNRIARWSQNCISVFISVWFYIFLNLNDQLKNDKVLKNHTCPRFSHDFSNALSLYNQLRMIRSVSPTKINMTTYKHAYKNNGHLNHKKKLKEKNARIKQTGKVCTELLYQI